MTDRNLSRRDLVGLTLGKYKLTALLGTGGMAEVYQAYQASLNRTVAIKLMHSHLAREEGFKERFQREARAVAALRHPNIIQIYDFDEDQGWYYMVMEYAGGGTLMDRLLGLHHAGQTMPLVRTLELMQGICSALDYAHQAGMVHRDIKPANIMFTAKDEPMLTDFGIARIVGSTKYTWTGSTSGTPAYMSPEQAMGERGDERSDIYSLGVMLYEITIGSLPYNAETPFGMIMKHVNEPLPSPRTLDTDFPTPVARVLEKALAKKPYDRYQTAGELVAALEKAVGTSVRANVDEDKTFIISTPPAVETEVTVPPPTAPPTPTPAPAKTRGALKLPVLVIGGLAGILVLIVAIYAGFLALRYFSRSGEEPRPTQIAGAVAVVEPTESPMEIKVTPSLVMPTFTPTATPMPIATEASSSGRQAGETISLAADTATPAPTETPTVVPATSTPTLAPLGPALTGRLLYVSDRDGDFEIYLKYLATDRPDEKLTENSGVNDWFPDWAADENRIIFTSNRNGNYDLYTMNPDGSSQTPYVTSAGWDEYGSWEPDSNRLVFATTADTDGVSNAELFVRNADGSLTRLTRNQGEDRNPDWSRTGEIYFASNFNGNWDIYKLPAGAEPGSTEPQNLTDHPAIDADPALSPDNTRLVFVRVETDTNGDGQVGDGDTGNVYLMNTDGSGTQAITTSNRDSSPAWSPDGAWVVYTRSLSSGSQASNLYAIHLSDGTTTQITEDSNNANWGTAWAE